jgi:hypothetical protein
MNRGDSGEMKINNKQSSRLNTVATHCLRLNWVDLRNLKQL